jgi:CelD/BcsL family acetyltransferase involved in cellulose biosynthesis
MVETEERPVPRVDFEALQGKTLAQAMPNAAARYALRRSLRDYESSLGATTLSVPRDVEEALRFFEEMKALHQKYWASKGQPGAFHSPLIQEFHRSLIRRAFPERSVRLYRIAAATTVIGYMYVFVRGGVASYYQSGYDYAVLEKGNRPGWLAMQLVMKALRREGCRAFDLLAGEHAYKHRLATHESSMFWVRCTRPRLRFRVDRLATTLVRKCRRA